MTWNHRVVRRTWKEVYEEEAYGIHEAFYDKKGKVFAITKCEVGFYGSTMKELEQFLQMMQRCLDRTKAGELSILDYDKIPEEGAEHP